MGNTNSCGVKGIGCVKIKMFNGIVIIVKDVRYVPNLSRNLISIGVFDDSGYEIKTKDGVKRIVKGSMVVIKGEK